MGLRKKVLGKLRGDKEAVCKQKKERKKESKEDWENFRYNNMKVEKRRGQWKHKINKNIKKIGKTKIEVKGKIEMQA